MGAVTLRVVYGGRGPHPDVRRLLRHAETRMGMKTVEERRGVFSAVPRSGRVVRTVMHRSEDFNQLLREVRPEVWVVDATGDGRDIMSFMERHLGAALECSDEIRLLVGDQF